MHFVRLLVRQRSGAFLGIARQQMAMFVVELVHYPWAATTIGINCATYLDAGAAADLLRTCIFSSAIFLCHFYYDDVFLHKEILNFIFVCTDERRSAAADILARVFANEDPVARDLLVFEVLVFGKPRRLNDEFNVELLSEQRFERSCHFVRLEIRGKFEANNHRLTIKDDLILNDLAFAELGIKKRCDLLVQPPQAAIYCTTCSNSRPRVALVRTRRIILND
jgi:hypothetical protein